MPISISARSFDKSNLSIGELAMGSKENLPDLHPLITDPFDLASEYRSRFKEFETIAVKPKNQESYEEDGWIYDKKLKRTVRLKKPKPHDECLENKFWCLLYKMGYPEMNQGRKFKIRYKRRGEKDGLQQIDVFAKDDESVVVAECKSSEEWKRRNLKKDIEAFSYLQGAIAGSIRRFYDIKPKMLWLFVTENIIWSREDRIRAKAANIKIIREREFRYFKRVVDHLGPASRYQFLAEYFEGQDIPGLKETIVPAIRGKLGGKQFYSFVTTPKQLLKISFINHRALLDPQGFPTYQRLTERTRLTKIGKFISKGGYFPTNLLINFNQKVRFDPSYKDDANDIHFGYLYFPSKYKSAWIIDGQHRLYAYSKLESECMDQNLESQFMDQNLMVLAFEQLPREEEANLFVTINHEQKQVSRTLLDDLEGDLKWGSTNPTERIGAIAARVTQLLNDDSGEPFHNRVTAQGIRGTEQTCLTVPEIKGGLKQAGLVGRAIMKKKVYEPGPLSATTDQDTLGRAQDTLNLYFGIIKDANPERWEKGRSGYLCSNPGVRGYLRLFGSLIEYMELKTKLDAKELPEDQLVDSIEKYLAPVLDFVTNADDAKFEVEFKVVYGSQGSRHYHYRMCRLVRAKYPDFLPEGYEEWELAQSEEQVNLAETRRKNLEIAMKKYIFDKFKEIHGEEDNAYFEKSTTDVDMKTKAYKRSQDYPLEQRLPLETYLDFIDLKHIIQKKNKWPLFKDVFNIALPGEKGLAKNLAWMDRFNLLRRIPSHPTEKRDYKVEDFKFLEWLDREFNSRLRLAKAKADAEKDDMEQISFDEISS